MDPPWGGREISLAQVVMMRLNEIAKILVGFALFGSLPLTAIGGLFDVATKVVPIDSSANDQFGRSVAIDKNIAVAGAWQFKFGGNGKFGYASVFDVTTGNELAKLTALDAAADDAFGTAVGLSGDTAVIGACLDDDNGNGSGSAYLFDVPRGRQLHKLIALDGAPDDQFGFKTAISGNKVVVGAPYNSAAGTEAGAAYVFDASTGTQLHKLNATDARAGDWFGLAIAIDGNVAAVGAQRKANRTGAVYLYDTVTGFQLLKLAPSNGEMEPNFGASVSINGNRLIVGAPGEDDGMHVNSGAAYVFDIATGNELHRLTASDASDNSNFGGSVSVSGNLAVIGAPGEGSDRGAAYVFDLTIGKELSKLTSPDWAFNDRFGEFVGIDGNAIVASVRLDDDHGTNSGSVYVFTPEPSTLMLCSLAICLYCRRRWRLMA